MGKRQDGRIEPGQKLSGAISARAWNRAQDAADIVLAERTGFGAGPGTAFPGALIVPCEVSTTVDNVTPGYVVKIVNAGAKTVPVPSNQQDRRAPAVFSFTGSVIVPVTLANYEDAKVQLAVIVGGAQMPRPGQSRIVNVCISGMCVARFRPRYVSSGLGDIGPYKFLSAPVKRTAEDTDAKLTGAGEASSCGTHRLIAGLGPADAEGFLSFAAVLM
jgi:hypothetical protein